MNIDVLYFEGCPTHETTVDLVVAAVSALGVEATVRSIDVLTEEQAAELEFLGSPSIRVDGVDIDPGAAGRTDFGRRCRVYPSNDGLSGLPPRAWLEATLRGELVVAAETHDAVDISCSSSSCCEGSQKSAPHVVLLVADWCPQCPSAKAYWSELSAELGFVLETVDLGTSNGAELAREHRVRALPTALVNDVVLAAGVARPPRGRILEALGA